ncbi:MAG: phosphoribosylanthranilate isomerase [Flavobacteriaceae bacterium]
MKHNIAEVAALHPDYLGFIFYEKSPRNFNGVLPELPSSIKKVGVFVDETVEKVMKLASKYQLDVIQLHGEESPNYCEDLAKQSNTLEIWKVFSIGETFNFKDLIPYEKVVNAFLFDTKGKNKGGNGKVFNWELLKKYPSQKPFILSGGIGLNEVDAIKEFLKKQDLPLYAIDLNSKFENSPGLKNTNALKQFFNEL